MQIGLSLSLGANLRSGGASFNPASLFASGEEGALIQRRSDAFFVENTASTHAVDTNAVGFATDGSEGAGYSDGAFTGLGPLLISEDSAHFTSGIGDWVAASGSTVAWETDRLKITGTATIAIANLPISTEIGAFYLTEISGTNAAVDITIRARIGSTNFGSAALPASSDYSHSFVMQGDGTSGNLQNYSTSGDGKSWYTTEVSYRELPGAHLTQATTSYKPSLQTGGLLFDGNDDRLTGAPKPTTSGTIAARFNGSTASRVIVGSQAASDGRCFLALDASGKIAAGIGAQGTSTIAGGADIRGAWHTAAVTWDGSTVTLYLDGVSVYSAAQSGAVNTTVAMMLGALNANGTAAAFWAGTVSDALAIDRVLTTDEITNLNDYWSA